MIIEGDDDLETMITPRGNQDPITFYISPQGNDLAEGQSEASGFRTLQHALEISKPGDTILVLPGTYPEAVYLEQTQNEELPIKIRGLEGHPVFDGERQLDIGFWCENCANFIIEGLEFRNYTDVGIGIYKSQDFTFRDLIVHHNGFEVQLKGWGFEGYGIHIDESQNVTVENCETYHNGPDPRPFGEVGTGINTYECTNCIIRNNKTYANIGGGILVEDGVNVLVEGNTITENYLDVSEDEWWDGGIWLDGGHDVVVRNNVIQNNQGPGIEISDEDFQDPYGYVLENNNITNNLYGLYIWNFGTADFPPEEILRLSNNQITNNAIQDFWIEP